MTVKQIKPQSRPFKSFEPFTMELTGPKGVPVAVLVDSVQAVRGDEEGKCFVHTDIDPDPWWIHEPFPVVYRRWREGLMTLQAFLTMPEEEEEDDDPTGDADLPWVQPDE